jgi:hypothetical protein|tara:strand:+ start:4901 stop:5149 length:249 start_codon:yes stop_codon:yes gene_type:complete
VLEKYRDCVDASRSQSLIALAAYYSGNYSVCGKACMKLRTDPALNKKIITSELTTEIFSKVTHFLLIITLISKTKIIMKSLN